MSFQTNFITIFKTNKCAKCPSSIRCQDSNPWALEREPLPITTKPGLPPTICLRSRLVITWGKLQVWREKYCIYSKSKRFYAKVHYYLKQKVNLLFKYIEWIFRRCPLDLIHCLFLLKFSYRLNRVKYSLKRASLNPQISSFEGEKNSKKLENSFRMQGNFNKKFTRKHFVVSIYGKSKTLLLKSRLEILVELFGRIFSRNEWQRRRRLWWKKVIRSMQQSWVATSVTRLG